MPIVKAVVVWQTMASVAARFGGLAGWDATVY